MNPSSDDRIAHLTGELARLERELAQLRQANPAAGPSGPRRWRRLQAAVPGLLLGAWVLSAGAPASQDDLEQRVSELEERLLKGPGTTTRIQAPFEVVGRGGNVILQVAQTMPNVKNGVGIFTEGQNAGVVVNHGGNDVAGLGTAEEGEGGYLYIGDQNGISRAEVRAEDGVSVLNAGGQVVAAMYAMDEGSSSGRVAIMDREKMIASLEGNDEGGVLDVSNGKGKTRAQLGVDDGNGYIATFYNGKTEVEMGLSDKGEPQLVLNQKGQPRAALRLSAGAGHLSVSNAKGSVVANVSGTGTADGGSVIVGNSSGKGIASLGTAANGSGLVQVFEPGGKSIAVMAQDKSGGLLQIKNGAGIPVANLKAADSDGGGYWQLTDPSGTPVVEAGADGARGVVRAGPFFECLPKMGTAIVAVAPLPDCIKGRSKR